MTIEPKRTQDLLFDALVDLLTKRSFDDICVTDICGRANVHRSTFYKYYVDKFELLEIHFRVIVEQSIQGKDDLARFLRHVEENTHLYKPLLLDPKNCEAEQIFQRELALRLVETDVTDTELSSQFLAGGLLSAVAFWLRFENRDVSGDRLRTELDRLFSKP